MTIGRALMNMFSFLFMLGVCGTLYGTISELLNNPLFADDEMFEGIRAYFGYDPALVMGLFVLLLVLYAVVSEPITKILNTPIGDNPTPSKPASATAKKSTPAVGKCQDCGCELLDTEASFCEDCQLAVFMADDEAVSLAKVLGDE